jgi:hypothetical protein
MNAFPIGTRLMQAHFGGYVNIGFFQLWNPQESGIREYPIGHTDAGRTDTLFAAHWPRGLRGFIPEVICYHLESVDASKAANWSGRTTAPFTHEAEDSA